MPAEWVEPDITINGTKLNFAQSLTVRVAIETFAITIGAMPGMGSARRQSMPSYEGYAARLEEIRTILFANQPRAGK
jgi:hypothetical protein